MAVGDSFFHNFFKVDCKSALRFFKADFFISYTENNYFSAMGKAYFAFFLLIFTFISCEEIPNEILLLNDNWQFSEAGKSDWKTAEIPGTVQADLLLLGEIPDPFLKNNEDSLQWVSTKNWQYKKQFSVSEENLKRTKHFLNFEGLDTYADVFLNDSLLLSANNAFRNWEIDVSNALKAEKRSFGCFQKS